MYQIFTKRFIDVAFSILVLPLFLFLYIIFGLLIKLDDKGRILYQADRIGKNKKLFKMYKFRSMKENAPVLFNDDGSTYNDRNDNRVTKVGKFMRETSIDEIPQILNVLKGDMSLIGPRASLSEVIETFKHDELDKMKVKPGITGFTQAYYRNGLSNREKRLKDAWYANNMNFWLDIKIFFKTIRTVLLKDGLYTNSSTRSK
ncbi:glycosyl transferase possibly involved in lipopolysaccharide synthesis [Planococcus donghaensis MPA1U2]|uniref:Glycosyl transferase possibly involved in lipopolysaccharide synthesis n=1 Tax=Planococcus donghaensis MPA1U2 TaxID=933115 RepID=E7RDR9_9BACL|nr:sugar transferase [Planococcus donghaensis]EGA90825.1 glycosyl transferase possibly involved in lipopolysaccharide synthesis [Planococcus donghaensis MPA1U2]